MKLKKIYSFFIIIFVLFPSVYCELFIQGTDSYLIFMDSSAGVNFTTDVKSFCGEKVLVKDSTEIIDSSDATEPDFTYANVNEFPCLDSGGSGGDDGLATSFDHGPGDIDVNTTTTALVYDLWVSKHHKLNFDTATAGGDITFDGQTHFAHCARETRDITGLSPIIIVSGGNDVEFKNVVLKDFSTRYIDLQNNSKVLFGDGTTLEITDNMVMDSQCTITVDGKVTINCFGNKLDITNVIRAIEINSSSTLVINNGHIKGLSGDNLRCLADDATLTLSNCILDLESEYSFRFGYLNIYQEVELVGTTTFEYKSPQQMRIYKGAKFKVGMGGIFSYNAGISAANAGNDKIIFEDESAKMFLEGCTFHVTTTGLQLTKGTLIVDHIVTFSSDGNNVFEAIAFGNGTASDNLNIEIMPGGNIELTSGFLCYLNAD